MSESLGKLSWTQKVRLFAAAYLLLLNGIGLGFIFREELEPVAQAANIMGQDLLTHPLTTDWRYDGGFGLEVLDPSAAEGHLLVSGFFMDEEAVSLRLIDLSSGETLKAWTPDPYEIRDLTDSTLQTPDRFEPQSPIPMADGGLIFIDNQGPLVRIDACSQIVWIAEGHQHHSLELDLEGNLIGPSVDPPLPAPYESLRNDSIARFSLDGDKLESTSVAQIMIDNGLEHLLNANFPYNKDAVHLNDVEVARHDGPFWRVGDLALSLRVINLVMIYRPSTGEIVWHSVGPWQKQHDPDFNADGTLSVFGNDTIDVEPRRLIKGHSDIYIVGRDKVIRTPYTQAMAAARVGTETQGLLDILPNGDAYVEETDRGRLVRIGADGLKWRFNNTNGKSAGVLNWSRHYPPGELPQGALKPCRAG